MKKIVLLGATGSVGLSTCELIENNLDKFKLVGISGHSRQQELKKIAEKFSAEIFNTSENENFSEFLKKCEPDIVINAIGGFAGLQFSWEILQQGINLALANKESLVACGELLQSLAKKNNAKILPVDSEHAALWQCLIENSDDNNIKFKPFKKLILTCSGGPFRGFSRENLSQVSISDALAHPTWKMGEKISIDSATLVNKCLEVFEAMHFFNAKPSQIEIVLHPESIVHSMVEFEDNSVLAQISAPDMKFPIAQALDFPNKKNYQLPAMDWKNLNLSFGHPDEEVFHVLKTLKICTQNMKNFPLVFNTANEVLVEKFLLGKISFLQISDLLEKVINETNPIELNDLSQVLEIDKLTRIKTNNLLGKY